MDLLGFGDATEAALLTTFREIMAIEADDGVHFDLKNLRIDAIREELEYGGSRLRTTAALAGARIAQRLDAGQQLACGGIAGRIELQLQGGQHAAQSQVRFHGLDPARDLIEIEPRRGHRVKPISVSETFSTVAQACKVPETRARGRPLANPRISKGKTRGLV